MSDNIPDNLTPMEPNPNWDKISNLTSDPTFQNHMYNKAWESISKNLYHQPSVPLKSDEEHSKHLANKLDKQHFELKQLNDKLSYNNLYTKELMANLEEEFSSNDASENNLSKKDKKILFVGAIITLLFLILEYNQSIIKFILSLISKE